MTNILPLPSGVITVETTGASSGARWSNRVPSLLPMLLPPKLKPGGSPKDIIGTVLPTTPTAHNLVNVPGNSCIDPITSRVVEPCDLDFLAVALKCDPSIKPYGGYYLQVIVDALKIRNAQLPGPGRKCGHDPLNDNWGLGIFGDGIWANQINNFKTVNPIATSPGYCAGKWPLCEVDSEILFGYIPGCGGDSVCREMAEGVAGIVCENYVFNLIVYCQPAAGHLPTYPICCQQYVAKMCHTPCGGR